MALVAPAGEIENRLADRTLRIRDDALAGTAQVLDAEEEAVLAALVYWSVWRRFYPDTGLWRGSG